MKNWIDLAIQQEYDVYYDVMMNYRYAFLHWQSRLFIVFLMIVRRQLSDSEMANGNMVCATLATHYELFDNSQTKG